MMCIHCIMYMYVYPTHHDLMGMHRKRSLLACLGNSQTGQARKIIINHVWSSACTSHIIYFATQLNTRQCCNHWVRVANCMAQYSAPYNARFIHQSRYLPLGSCNVSPNLPRRSAYRGIPPFTNTTNSRQVPTTHVNISYLIVCGNAKNDAPVRFLHAQQIAGIGEALVRHAALSECCHSNILATSATHHGHQLQACDAGLRSIDDLLHATTPLNWR